MRDTVFKQVPGLVLTAYIVLLSGIGHAQETGQLASDVLGMTDLWGNPTFQGWAVHGGANAHSLA